MEHVEFSLIFENSFETKTVCNELNTRMGTQVRELPELWGGPPRCHAPARLAPPCPPLPETASQNAYLGKDLNEASGQLQTAERGRRREGDYKATPRGRKESALAHEGGPKKGVCTLTLVWSSLAWRAAMEFSQRWEGG